jgi:hypothetical protein
MSNAIDFLIGVSQVIIFILFIGYSSACILCYPEISAKAIRKLGLLPTWKDKPNSRLWISLLMVIVTPFWLVGLLLWLLYDCSKTFWEWCTQPFWIKLIQNEIDTEQFIEYWRNQANRANPSIPNEKEDDNDR